MFRDMNSGYSGYSMSNRVTDDNGKLLLKKKIDVNYSAERASLEDSVKAETE